MPWSALCALIEPFYPKLAGQWPPADRSQADAAHLFLAAVVQLSDPAVEEALYGSSAMRRFVGIAR